MSENFKVSLNYIDEDLRRKLKLVGVPPSLIYPFSVDVMKSITPFKVTMTDGTIKTFSAKKQVEVLNAFRKSRLDKPFKMVFNATERKEDMRRVALYFFWNAYAECLDDRAFFRGKLPTWTFIDNKFSNPHVEDQYEKDSRTLLTIDGLSTDMGSVKLDKTRDVLDSSGDRPVILLLSGDGAFEFCRDRLFFKANNMIRLGNSVIRKVDHI
jgi:hypothetical protein